jgi:hypothetical protein
MRRPKISEKRAPWVSLAMAIFPQLLIAVSMIDWRGTRADAQTAAKSAYLSR